MVFSGIQKTTLIDYPGKVAATLFTYGCNFKCPFCHNPELVIEKEGVTIDEKIIFQFLNSRVGKLDGIVITGGEPLLQCGLKKFLLKVRKKGFLIKVDTNGSFPDRIMDLIDIVDYWAMDIKNSLEKYSITAGSEVKGENIQKSIKIIMKYAKDYEFRTTVVPGLHDADSIANIGKLINGCKRYTIQNFRCGKTISSLYKDMPGFNTAELKNFKKIMRDHVDEVNIIENL